MLWLAGLMGIVGIGAASLVAVHTPEEDGDSLADEDVIDEAMMAAPGDGFFEPDDPEAASDLPDDPMAGTLHAGMLDAEDELPAVASANPGSNFDDLHEDDAAADPTEPEEPFDFSVYDAPEYANFMVGDWISNATGPEVLDYEAARESIVVVWDDTDLDAVEPTLSVSPDPDDPEVMQVNADGKVLADIYGDCDLSVCDLTLIPLSSALIVGLTPT